jgi:hypothetical protein
MDQHITHKLKDTNTLLQTRGIIFSQKRVQLHIGRFVIQPKRTPNQQLKSQSNLKRTAKLQGQALQPDLKYNTHNSTKVHATAYCVAKFLQQSS